MNEFNVRLLDETMHVPDTAGMNVYDDLADWKYFYSRSDRLWYGLSNKADNGFNLVAEAKTELVGAMKFLSDKERSAVQNRDDLTSPYGTVYPANGTVSRKVFVLDLYGNIHAELEDDELPLLTLLDENGAGRARAGAYEDGRTYPAYMDALDEAETLKSYEFMWYVTLRDNLEINGTELPYSFFIIADNVGTSRDQITGVLHSQRIKERNVYGRVLNVHESTLKENNLVWSNDLRTYVSLFDPNVRLVRTAEGRHVQLPSIQSEGHVICSRTHMYTKEPVTMHDGSIISSKFYRDGCFTCTACGGVFLLSERVKDRGVCESCYKPTFEELIRRYDHNVFGELGYRDAQGEFHPSNNGIPAKQRYVGVELEMYAKDREACVPYVWEINKKKLALAMHDGTLDRHENGLEITSSPVHIAQAHKHFEELMNLLPEDEFFTDASCGVHMHISRSSVTEAQIGRLMTFLYNPNNRKFLEDIAGRAAGSRWCKFNTHKNESSYLEKQYRTQQTGGKECRVPTHRHRMNGEKYFALNIPRDKPTIEFRLFQGTVSKTTLFVYLEFVQAVLAFTAPGSGNKVMNYYNLLGQVNRTLYPNLVSFLQERGYTKKVKYVSK